MARTTAHTCTQFNCTHINLLIFFIIPYIFKLLREKKNRKKCVQNSKMCAKICPNRAVCANVCKMCATCAHCVQVFSGGVQGVKVVKISKM